MQYLGGKSRIAKPIADIILANRGARGLVARGAAVRGSLIMRADYRDVISSIDLADAVIYADPPYAGTTAYGNVEPFDNAEFWREMEACARGGAAVFVSEYMAPAGWIEVWSAEPLTSLRVSNVDDAGTARRVTERLFTWGGGE